MTLERCPDCDRLNNTWVNPDHCYACGTAWDATAARTTYTVTDSRGVSWRTNCAERAERLARAGLTVTAVTQG